MRISLNWLKKLVKIEVTDEELVRRIGARLVEVEGVIDETHKYDNIYVAEVVSAEHIEGTHLSLCQVRANLPLSRDGSLAPVFTGLAPSSDASLRSLSRPKGRAAAASGSPRNEANLPLIQVVCGAPNVRAGMLAVWIAPGAVVPASVHEDAPFVIGKRKMLGKYDSYGMLAGADELDFGDDHSGIVEIDPKMAKAGDKLADVFELRDKILDIENKSLTHRPDCFGMIGFAREVAGILGQDFVRDFPESASSDDPEKTDPKTMSVKSPSKISIKIENNTICSRYTAMVLEKHGEMKKKYLTWEDTVLAKAGMRPIDPIVDATNYMMLLTGQPLHAFDYDKLVRVGGGKEPEIVARLAKPGETLELLDGKTVELNESDIVICSGKVPVALAGAMGGASTMIDEKTRKIVLESATFSLYNLRKTQMAHGIFSEAITRFTKGQPPYQTLAVAEGCAEMLIDGFRVVEVADAYPEPEEESVVKITTLEVNRLLGTDYSDELIVKTLQNVGIRVTAIEESLEAAAHRHLGRDGERSEVPSASASASASGVSLNGASSSGAVMEIHTPLWRTDLHIKEDIIEEVGRLLGYDNIAPVLPRHQTASKNPELELKQKVRRILASYGANEVLTYSFVSGRLLEKAGLAAENSYRIVNSISPELQYVRQSIVPSLLEKAYMNQKFPIDELAIFEINKVYQKAWGMDAEGVPVERMRLGLVVAERKGTGTAYYKAKLYVDKLLEWLGVRGEYRALLDGGVDGGAEKATEEAKTVKVTKTVKAVEAVEVTKIAERAKAAKDAQAAEKGEALAPAAAPLEPKRAAAVYVDGQLVGYVGELKRNVRQNYKLAEYTAVAELSMEALEQMQVKERRLPENFVVRKKLDETITTTDSYAEAYKKICQQYPGARVTPVGIYQPEPGAQKNITFHIELL